MGRLDTLDAVGVKALDYYAHQDERQLEAESLGRRARALHLLGEISNLKGDVDVALARFTLAAQTTKRQLELDPTNPQRIFDHAQSVFWLGLLAYYEGRYSDVRPAFDEYLAFAEQLVAIDGEDERWLTELFYAHQNLGALLVEQQRWQEAVVSFDRALEVLVELEQLGYPQTQSRADLNSWLRDAHLPQLNFEQAQFHSAQETIGYQTLLEQDPGNAMYRMALAVSFRGDAKFAMINNDIEGALGLLLPQQMEIMQLIAVEPDNTALLEQQALLYRQISSIRLLQGEWELAASLANTCKELAESLQKRNDSNLFWRTGIDWPCTHIVAAVALHLGQIAQASDKVNSYFPQLMKMYEDNTAGRDVEMVLANSALLLGDIALASGNQSEAVTYWQQVNTVLGDEPESLTPRSIVVLITALKLSLIHI